MRNIKDFKKFTNQPINEGVLSNIKRKLSKLFKPGDLGETIKRLLKYIQYNFDSKSLTMHSNLGVAPPSEIDMEGSKVFLTGIYNVVYDDINTEVKVRFNSSSHEYQLYLDGDDVTEYVNQYIIADLFEFLLKEYKSEPNFYLRNVKDSKLSQLRTKYGNRWYPEEDGEY